MPGEFAQQRSFGFFEYQAVDERMPLSGVEAIEGANQLDASLDLMRPQPCAYLLVWRGIQDSWEVVPRVPQGVLDAWSRSRLTVPAVLLAAEPLADLAAVGVENFTDQVTPRTPS